MESWTVLARMSSGVREKKIGLALDGAGLDRRLILVADPESVPDIDAEEPGERALPSTVEV